ncbi:MAG: AarF/ABC1/UbiB kinase family protein [Sandaracinaceae bacterium]|nr:AarF/ABC1/UbiB kinase family protein [Sandaracinaceae bacterium]
MAWQVREVSTRTWDETRALPAKAGRMAAAGWCLTKIASSYRLHVTRAAFVSRARAARQLEALHETNARRFYELCAAHGGAFLKVAQLLSARADLLPAAWVRELSTLQDQAPRIDFAEVRRVIEEDHGKPLEALFASFDEEPIAAASIGQVHRAVDHQGRELAVKVRRPRIETLLAHDLDLLQSFVEGARDSLPKADWDTVIPEIRAMVEAELDYGRERGTMQRLGAFLARVEGVHAPAPVGALSSDRVLVASFERGRRVTDVLDELTARGETERVATILGRMLEAFVAQVLEAGIFQADPHPGNFLVTEDDRVVVLDFGCAKELPSEVRDLYLSLMQAALLSDRDRLVSLLDALGFRTESGSHATLERFAEVMLRDFRAAAASGRFHFPSRESMLHQVRALAGAAEDDPVVKVPEHFVMLGRVFGTLGGLFVHYQPSIDYARHVLPAYLRAMG